MFTLEKATQIFPDTLSADVVPAITARFRLLSAEDQLALIWYAYLEMGSTITVAAPGAARNERAIKTIIIFLIRDVLYYVTYIMLVIMILLCKIIHYQ